MLFAVAPVFPQSIFSLFLIPENDCMHLLTHSLLAGQRALQGHAGGRQVWTGAGLKHGGDVEGHPVCSKPSLDKAREDVGGVVTVVRDAAQAGVDGDHHQKELY